MPAGQLHMALKNIWNELENAKSNPSMNIANHDRTPNLIMKKPDIGIRFNITNRLNYFWNKNDWWFPLLNNYQNPWNSNLLTHHGLIPYQNNKWTFCGGEAQNTNSSKKKKEKKALIHKFWLISCSFYISLSPYSLLWSINQIKLILQI